MDNSRKFNLNIHLEADDSMASAQTTMKANYSEGRLGY